MAQFAKAKDIETPRGGNVETGGIATFPIGGMNLSANSLNCPLEDSPLLLNVDIDEGSLTKRKGTRLLSESIEGVESVSTTTFTTGSGQNYIIAKFGTTLRVYQTINNVNTLLISKDNVWADSSRYVKADSTKTLNGLILTTGRSAPIELEFLERNPDAITLVSGTTHFIFNNAADFEFANSSNTVIYNNKTKLPLTNAVYTSGNTQLDVTVGATGLSSVLLDFSMVYISWSWYAESYKFDGDQLYQSTTRTHLAAIDQNVIIPGTIRDNINPISLGNYPIGAFKSTQWGNGYTPVLTRKPQTADEYSFGDGTVYIYNAAVPNNLVNPSTSHITFGTVRLPNTSPAEPVHLIRGREILFNGGIGAVPADITVLIDGVVQTRSTNTAAATGAYGAYYLRDTAYNIITGATGARFISFDASSSIGVAATSIVTVVNTKPSGLGTGATSSAAKHKDGSYKAVHGLGEFSDYLRGSHPRTVTLFQGRLVFGGFPSAPLLVVCSAVTDSITPGIPYNNFQTYLESGKVTDAFDIIIPGVGEDRVNGVYQFQNSLIIFCRRSIWQVVNTTGAISVGSQARSISTLGNISPQTITRAENTIMFLSDSGVYDLGNTLDSGDYEVAERTAKIRDIFENLPTTAESLAWLSYDSTRRLLYLALPTTKTYTSDRLFIYNTIREAWTEYDTPGNFNTFSGLEYKDTIKGNTFITACTRQFSGGGAPLGLLFLSFYGDRPLDYLATYSPAASYQSTVIQSKTHTTQNRIQEYEIGFRVNPLPVIEDILVKLNGVRLTIGVDYYKTAKGTVYLIANPGVGKTLVITLRRDSANTEVGQKQYNVTQPVDLTHAIAYRDNVLLRENIDFTITNNLLSITVSPPVNSVIEVGQVYPAIYQTPLFTRGSLAELKRHRSFYTLFNNEDGEKLYKLSDVNTLSGQNSRELVGAYKVRLNANLALIYDTYEDVDIARDLYGYVNPVWDNSFYDISQSGKQYDPQFLSKEALQGIGYSLTAIIWSEDESSFSISALQIDADNKGKRFQNRFR